MSDIVTLNNSLDAALREYAVSYAERRASWKQRPREQRLEEPLGLDLPTQGQFKSCLLKMTEAAGILEDLGPDKRLNCSEVQVKDLRNALNRCAAVCQDMGLILRVGALQNAFPAPELSVLDSWGNLATVFADWARAVEVDNRPVLASHETTGEGIAGGRAKGLSYIHTSLKQPQLAKLFHRLAEQKLIGDSTNFTCASFCNAFNPEAKEQGRIKWIKKPRKGGQPCAMVLDFVDILENRDVKEWIDDFQKSGALNIFDISIDRSARNRFETNKLDNKGSEQHNKIKAIIESVNKEENEQNKLPLS